MQIDLLAQIREGGILYILLLISITMHEFGHAYMADKLGDKLPRLEGRVTINPLAHIDVTGTVVLPILTMALSMESQFPVVFGWGKPVRIALDNPKTRTKVDILSTAGGVCMNLVSALFFALVASIMMAAHFNGMGEFAVYGIYINCALFVINMIPVPPLDGSKFLKYAVGMSDFFYYSLARWGLFIFLLLILIPQTKIFLSSCIEFVSNMFLLVVVMLTKLLN